ncbi:MAG: DNA primase [Methanomassiliicoccales archaeon]|nr:MAG: DNA primase [Methanomassiliicoccales archaeon]
MNIDPSTTKYMIIASIVADGIVEKPDVVGAIFGQTEGLLGNELDLRDMQKSGRIGRIEVEIGQNKGKSEGEITIPSSLDQVETVILASALETIDRVGPCRATIKITKVEDVRLAKKKKIVERAKTLLSTLMANADISGESLTSEVRQAVQVEEIIHYGKDKCPAGPNVPTSDAIIVVEGRSDVLNLLKHGIKNAIAVEGTNIPKSIQDLSKERVVTAFVDGDRGGELILRELLQVAEVDFVARAPQTREVEDLTQKQIMKGLRNKIPAEQFIEMYGLEGIELPQAGIKNSNKVQTNVQAPKGPQKQPPKSTNRRGTTQRGRQGGEDTKKTKILSDKQQKYKNILENIAGSSKAQMLNASGSVVEETPLRDLAETLKKTSSKINTLVFDGIITQRLIDIAAEKGISTIVGSKLGNVSKQLTSIEILTKNDLS